MLWTCNCRQKDSSWTPQNDCNWNYLAHTLSLHKVGALWGFCDCSHEVPGSSFGSINWKSGHICCSLCTDTFCGLLESLCVNGIATFITVVKPLMCLSIAVWFLQLICCWAFMSLVWFQLNSWSSLLIVSICGKFCSLVSHQVNLSDLQISSYLFNMMHSGLGTLKHFASWKTLLAGNFFRSTLPSVIVLDTKSSSCKKNEKMS